MHSKNVLKGAVAAVSALALTLSCLCAASPARADEQDLPETEELIMDIEELGTLEDEELADSSEEELAGAAVASTSDADAATDDEDAALSAQDEQIGDEDEEALDDDQALDEPDELEMSLVSGEGDDLSAFEGLGDLEAQSSTPVYRASDHKTMSFSILDSPKSGYVLANIKCKVATTSIVRFTININATHSNGLVIYGVENTALKVKWGPKVVNLKSKRTRITLDLVDKDGSKSYLQPGDYSFYISYLGPSSRYSSTANISFRYDTSTLFFDLPSNHWAVNCIGKAVKCGYMKGYDKGDVFGVNDLITRGQVATVLWNMEGKPEPRSTKRYFNDVSSGAYYAKAVSWAYEQGVVSGYGNGRFKPDNNISRQELSTMLHNYATKYHHAANGGANPSSYARMSDRNSVSSYARPAVGWCFHYGVLSGAGSKINPKNNATRAEAAKMFVRVGEILGR